MKFRFQNIFKKRVASRFHPFFIFFFLFPYSSFCSFNYSPKVDKAYQDFLKLKIISGQKTIEEAQREDPDNGLVLLMANYGEAISIFISEDKSLYNRNKSHEDARIKKISSLSKSSPYYLFCQAEIKLHWAFVKLKFGDEISAVWNVRAAFKLLEQNAKLFPDFVANKKTLGLLNIVFGSIPDKYASLAGLVGMKGDVKKGMEQLSAVAGSNSPFALEANFYKVLAENYILKNESGQLKELQKLYLEHEDNLLLSYIYASLLIKNAYADEALKVLQERPSGSAYISFPYLDFLTGEVYLYKADYPKARIHYQKFLDQYLGKNFIKDAYYKLFLTYYLSNDETHARPYMQKILNSGQKIYEGDKYAQKFAEKGELPEKILMKARLYFDGGYYQQALQTISAFQVNASRTKKDMIEYNYRKGRIYHGLDNYSQAILFYLKTIELSRDVSYYFAPNAALQMGYIYKEQNNKELARLYFTKARSYQNYEYKNSIDNKAKAALNELQKK